MSAEIRPIALVDCNNFFVSCERVFQPWLEGKPLIVLSSNDGCAISRSEEAKALGIEMGAPWFKIRGVARQHGIQVRSPNFALYSDMSRRVAETLETVSPDVEIYSVDECFLGLDVKDDLAVQGKQIRQRVLQWTGIPASVGIGPTKTLAKLAAWMAKKHPDFRGRGVCSLMDKNDRDRLLPLIPVNEVWGIGRKLAEKLNYVGIFTAADLCNADLRQLRGILNVVGARTVEELRGIPCLSLDLLPAPQKGVAVTRSFGRVIADEAQMKNALSGFAENAGEKLRRQGLAARHMQVFVRSRKNDGARRIKAHSMTFETPTDCTIELVRMAALLLKEIWTQGDEITKAGIILGGLAPKDEALTSLFAAAPFAAGGPRQTTALMRAMDDVNRRFGRRTVSILASGVKGRQPWKPLSAMRSPQFTTSIKELPRLHA